MRRSQSFIKTRKEAPADEEAANAQLLIRAGYIHKEMAGVYSYLPLGLKVIENIKQIVREEINTIGGAEMQLSSLQDKQIWEASNRWSDEAVDIWFKTTLKSGGDLGLGWSHEEPMARLMTQFVNSYKDLPVYVYQFQNKLRNELRVKSGLLRGREFIMKDLYSFSREQADHDKFYDQASEAYMKIYKRLGIGNITYKTFASGGPFSKFSHEFQTISPAGEDTVFVDETKRLAVNKEVMSDEVLHDLGLSRDELIEKKAVEVGNIFTFGSRYSEPVGLLFADEDGQKKPVFMGSYGIGISRLMGLLAEHFADDKGLNWPVNIAPYKIYLASLAEDQAAANEADVLYKSLTAAGIDVIFDDRPASPGEKFADADLMGMPLRVIASQNSLNSGGFEVKHRSANEISIIPKDNATSVLAEMLKS